MSRSTPTKPADSSGSEVDARYVLEDQVGFLLRVAVQRHTSIFAERMPGRLTPTQFAAIAKLREVGTCSQNALGRSICLDAATTKGVIGRLETSGLVTTRPDTGDRRRVLASLTDAGRDLADRATQMGRVITDRTLEPLDEAERQTLCALLARIG